jgi:hypothetical protein
LSLDTLSGQWFESIIGIEEKIGEEIVEKTDGRTVAKIGATVDNLEGKCPSQLSERDILVLTH